MIKKIILYLAITSFYFITFFNNNDQGKHFFKYALSEIILNELRVKMKGNERRKSPSLISEISEAVNLQDVIIMREKYNKIFLWNSQQKQDLKTWIQLKR